MKIALIGATGNVGQRVTAEALRRGHEVVAIARDVSKLGPTPGVTAVAADLTDKAAIGAAIEGADAVVLSVRFQDLDIEGVLDALADAKRLLIVGGRGLALCRAGAATDRHRGLPPISSRSRPSRRARHSRASARRPR
ncbi:MAG: NAD(P)H-binding protein [Sphingomonas sp.]